MNRKERRTEAKLRLNEWNEIYNFLLPNHIEKYDLKRYFLLYGGASSGKSAAVVISTLIRCITEVRQVMAFRKQSATARRTIWKTFKSFIKKLNLDKLMKIEINETYMEIKFENGSTISCSGADDVEKIKSLPDLDDIILEEATDFKLEDFKQLTIRLRGTQKHKHIYLMLNPVSKGNWVYQYFFENATEELKQDTFYIKTTYKDNKFVDDGEIRTLENYRKTDPDFYKVYGLGQWGVLRGKVFTNYRLSDLTEKQVYQVLKMSNVDFDTRYGMDFGYDDPTVILKAIVDNDNSRIYVVDEVYESELTLKQTADIIKQKNWKMNKILADSAGKTQIQSLNKDYNLKNIKAVKKPRIKESVENLKGYEIIILNNCKNTYLEIENYEQLEDNKFSEKNNHAIDALRYLMTERGTRFVYLDNASIDIFQY